MGLILLSEGRHLVTFNMPSEICNISTELTDQTQEVQETHIVLNQTLGNR